MATQLNAQYSAIEGTFKKKNPIQRLRTSPVRGILNVTSVDAEL